MKAARWPCPMFYPSFVRALVHLLMLVDTNNRSVRISRRVYTVYPDCI